ncbi:MAG: heparinase II/III family protein [Bryobacteraceae bacterium]|nr:heparinase II/III family protein [Bryobacteraceae bacterium]
MSSIARRTFTAAGLAAGLATGAASAASRRRLAGVVPPEALAEVLLPAKELTYFPRVTDRAAWNAIGGEARTALIGAAETESKAPWTQLPASLFLEYKRNGNRSRFEAQRRRRRDRLTLLVLAECCENQGRFLDDIANGLWLISEETWWGVPAHIGVQKIGVDLPDPSEQIIDLFAADTGSVFAWTDYLLGERLDTVSSLLRPRLRAEVTRRLLDPYLARDFSWMGFSSPRPVNNWNPWINSNIITCTLLVETVAARRVALVHKILRSLDRFIEGYADDGGCDEGPGYWGHAAASLYECLDLLHAASKGKIDGFEIPVVAEMGRYIYRAHIAGDWYTNFADAAPRLHPAWPVVYRYGMRIGDERLQRHAAYVLSLSSGARAGTGSTARSLMGLLDYEEVRKLPATPPLLRDVWLPGVQVMAARVKEGAANGFYLAAQGGHNAESHNHNDVGNFIVYLDGKPLLIDVGVESYTSKTFSSRRYEIWTMQSAYHNLPTIGGAQQQAGREYEAAAVEYKATDEAAEYALDIHRAWDANAGVKRWRRTLRLDRRANRVSIAEDYALARPTAPIELNLMTPHPVTAGAGEILFAKAARLRFDGARLRTQIDEIAVNDERLTPVWGARLYRVRLVDASPALTGRFELSLETA